METILNSTSAEVTLEVPSPRCTHMHTPHMYTPHTHTHLSFTFWEMASHKGPPYSSIPWNTTYLYLSLMTEEKNPFPLASRLPEDSAGSLVPCSFTHGAHSLCFEMVWVSKCPHCGRTLDQIVQFVFSLLVLRLRKTAPRFQVPASSS